MKNIYLILLSVSLWGTCNCVANYEVVREGNNISLSFIIRNSSVTIGKNEVNIFNLERNPLKYYNESFGERIQYDVNQTQKGGNFIFTLLNATSSDAGYYECKTIDKTEDSLLLVILREPTQPEVESDSQSPVAGTQMTLTCNSTSRSLPSNHSLVMGYRWRKNGNDLEPHANSSKFTGNVSKADRGDNYSCQAYEDGLDSKWSFALTVQPQYGPDSINVSSTSVLEGEIITCSADCNPSCNITWNAQDGQVTTGKVGLSMDRGQSRINCTAWNIHGNISTSFNVNVFFPPELRFEDCNKTTHEGGSLTFTGLVRSNPEPNMTIHSPNGTGVPMTLKRIHNNTYNISYTIYSAKCDDHGLYEVTAENQYGSTNSSVTVTVSCSPRLFHKRKPVKTLDNTWSFMIQAYPEATLEGIFSMSPGRDAKAISLTHTRIPNEQQTEDGLTTQSNLHEFYVNFPCESLGETYLLTFINIEGKKNISFFLEEDHCKAPADATVMITVVIVTIILVLILLTSGLVIYRRRKSAGQRRYSPHRTGNTTRNNTFRQEYATVPRKTDRPAKDVYAKVKKGKPIVCRNKVYGGAGNSSREALIVRRASPSGEGPLNNCGERNKDGLIYADLDLLPPTLNNGAPVIVGTREETVYVDIDFTKTPGPQLPDKIWEVEKK